MNSEKLDKVHYEIFIFIVIILSLFLFFQDKSIPQYFENDDLSAYADLSKNIFKPNFSYFAESILLPLLAKLLGASSSLQAYKVFCAVVTIAILPILAIASYKYYKNIGESILFILIIAAIFPFYKFNHLGMPDPLAVLFIMLATLQRNATAIFWCVVGACLTHLSMAVISTATLILFYFSTSDQLVHIKRLKIIKYSMSGIIIGKLILLVWYYLFEYQLDTRVDWIKERGLDFFVNRFQSDIMGFIVVPTVSFLIGYFILLSYFIFERRINIVVSMLAALILAYAAHFITIDGLRIFAVVISGATAFAAKEFVVIVFPKIENNIKMLYDCFVNIFTYLYKVKFYILCGILTIYIWNLVINTAIPKGLLLNNIPHINISILNIKISSIFQLLCGIVIFLSIAVRNSYNHHYLRIFAKIFFLLPMLIILIQYSRQYLLPEQSLPIAVQIICTIFMLIVLSLFLKIKIYSHVERSKRVIIKWLE